MTGTLPVEGSKRGVAVCNARRTCGMSGSEWLSITARTCETRLRLSASIPPKPGRRAVRSTGGGGCGVRGGEYVKLGRKDAT